MTGLNTEKAPTAAVLAAVTTARSMATMCTSRAVGDIDP
jgi:hypothetical protein